MLNKEMTDEFSDLLLVLFGYVPVFWVDYRKNEWAAVKKSDNSRAHQGK